MHIFDNLLMLIDMGGPVMLPIFLVSALLWGLIVLKADWIRRSGKEDISLHQAMEHLKNNQLCDQMHSPRALALNYFMESIRRSGKRECLTGKLFLEAAIRRQTGAIQRHIPAIIILAAAAPLLGLFGTVSGMVETFRVIGMYGMGNAQAMASGIREAMITTQAGLLVAIPGIFIGQVLKKKATNIQRELLVFQRGIALWMEKEFIQ